MRGGQEVDKNFWKEIVNTQQHAAPHRSRGRKRTDRGAEGGPALAGKRQEG